jgi:predicted nucleotidyltransferase
LISLARIGQSRLLTDLPDELAGAFCGGSNRRGPLLEWLQSPIVYREVESATRRLRGLIPEYYSPVSCFHHYLHMAEGNYREYLRGDEVWVKKYFYVLRPVLACQWIER